MARGPGNTAGKAISVAGRRRQMLKGEIETFEEMIDPASWKMDQTQHDLTPQAVFRRMEDRIRHFGSQRAWARHLGVTPGFVALVLYGKRPPGRRILNDIGVEIRHQFVDKTHRSKT